MSFPIALPKEILPTPEGAMSAGVTSQWVRVQPNNVSQVTSTATAVSNFLAVPTQITLGAQQLNFDLPTGQGANVYCDTAKSTISFRVKYAVTTAATTNYTGTSAYLQSSAHSFINRMTTYVAGQVVDDIVGYDVAMSEATNWEYDVNQRDTLFNLGFLGENGDTANSNYLQGHSIPAFTGTTLPIVSNFFSYELPLHNSLFGVLNKSMLPIGKLAKSSISLFTPQIAPVTILNSTTAAGAGAVVQITIDQIAINLFTVSLDEPSMKLLNSPSQMYMAGSTYRVGSGTINAGTTGSVSVQVPVRVRSARALSTRFNEALVSTAGSLAGIYDSKMPLVSSMNYFIASQKRVPPVPHNTLISPATVYSRAIMANFESTYSQSKIKSAFAYTNYYRYLATGTAPTDATCDKLVVDSGSTTKLASLASFSFSEDLRASSSSSFLAGQDLTVSNTFWEGSISNAPSNNVNLTFIATADIIFVLMPDGSVESRV